MKQVEVIMGMAWKKGAALVLGLCLSVSALSGCSKKAAQAAVYTMNGKEVDGDLTNFLFRLQQAQFEESYGQLFAQLYGGNVWEMDLSGTGVPYGDTFKAQFGSFMEQMLLARDHAGDYGVEISDADKTAISEAADKFITANSEDTLKSMSATKEVVEEALTLYTIRSRVENAVAEGADKEVSDEEAAQRTVSYIEYTPTVPTEEETEAETEAEFENTTEAEAAVETAAETEADALTQTEASDKTGSSDTGSETEADTEADTEIELIVEEEPETEDPAMVQAREEYRAMAEAELEKILSGSISFADAQTEAADGTAGVQTSTMSFGKDDEYTDAAIIEATNDLPDDTTVDHIVDINDVYYILHVDYALDKDATENKKAEIISERENQLISETYEKWQKDVDWTVSAEALAALSFNTSYVVSRASDVSDIIQQSLASTEAESSAEGSTEADAVYAEASTGAEAAAAAETAAEAQTEA